MSLHSQDPFESDEEGWTDEGYYVTGCSKDWISLRLVGENGEEIDLETNAIAKEALEGEVSKDSVTSAAFHVGSSIIHAFLVYVLFVNSCKM